MKHVLVLALVSLLLTNLSLAQNTTPEQAALDISLAYKQLDFDKAATLMHPEALNSFKTLIGDIVSLDSSGSAAFLLTGDMDPAAIQDITAQAAFARFMEGIIQIQPDMADGFASLETETLGHIMEGESTAHVVTRGTLTMMGIEMEQMEVMTLRLHDDNWLAMLSGDISSIAQAFKANLGG